MPTMQEWKDVWAGRIEMDMFEFSLFIENDPAFLREAFGSLHNGHRLIEKLEALFSESRLACYVIPDPKNYLPEAALWELMHEYCRAVDAYLVSVGKAELAAYCRLSRVEVVYDNSEFLSDERWRHCDDAGIEYELNHLFREDLRSVGPGRYCLKEAVHFLTKYFGLTRYLLEDVIDFPMKSRAYYELWRAGGDVAFYKDRIVMLCEAGPMAEG
jgi:hypothetical protein